MRLRRNPEARNYVGNHDLAIQESQALKLAGRWQSVFTADKPLAIEIGMGQGHFLYEKACLDIGFNYIGLEKRAEPIMWLLKDMPQPYPANLRIVNGDAMHLTELFAPQELSMIYLFFPDPWPKSRHAKRRLTAPAFVQEYQRILKPAGQVVFRTDSAAFFHWSCESFQEAGWGIAKASEDWQNKENQPMTYYEKRFRGLGQPICYAEFVKTKG